MLNDFFAAGALIKARLSAQIPALRAVYDAWDIAQLRDSERTLLAPSADVIYLPDGLRYISAAGTVHTRMQQTWGVVVRSRPDGDDISGTAARAQIGPLVMQILAALQGWRPSNELSELMAVSPTDALYQYIGELEFPLAFTVNFHVRSIDA